MIILSFMAGITATLILLLILSWDYDGNKESRVFCCKCKFRDIDYIYNIEKQINTLQEERDKAIEKSDLLYKALDMWTTWGWKHGEYKYIPSELYEIAIKTMPEKFEEGLKKK